MSDVKVSCTGCNECPDCINKEYITKEFTPEDDPETDTISINSQRQKPAVQFSAYQTAPWDAAFQFTYAPPTIQLPLANSMSYFVNSQPVQDRMNKRQKKGVQHMVPPVVNPIVHPITNPTVYPMVHPMIAHSIKPQQAAYQPMVQQMVYQQMAMQPMAIQPVAIQPVAIQPVAIQPMVQQMGMQPMGMQPMGMQPMMQQMNNGYWVRL